MIKLNEVRSAGNTVNRLVAGACRLQCPSDNLRILVPTKLRLAKGKKMLRCLIVVFGILAFSPGVSAQSLIAAASSGDVEMASRLLDEGANIDELSSMGTALHAASLRGHTEMVRLLIRRGATLDAEHNLLGTPLHAAARFNNVAVLNILVAAGANLEVFNNHGYTAIQIAVIESRLEAVQALIELGANVNAIGHASYGGYIAQGETSALHLARRLGYRKNPKYFQIEEVLEMAGAVSTPIERQIISDVSAKRGRVVAMTFCRECHALEPGHSQPLQPSAGPPLIGVANRPVANLSGFDYSDYLVRFGGTWTPDRLYSFVRFPMLTVPGTKMFWVKPTSNQERADLVAYLMAKD